jgi:hypothetical protein
VPGGGERGEWAGGVLVCSLFPGLGVRCGSRVVAVQRSAGRAVCGLWLCCSHCAGCVGASTPTPATTIVFCRQSAALAGDVQGVPVREPRVVCSSARGVRSARSAGGRGVGRGASHLTYLPEKVGRLGRPRVTHDHHGLGLQPSPAHRVRPPERRSPVPRGRPSCAPLGRCASATGRDVAEMRINQLPSTAAEIALR